MRVAVLADVHGNLPALDAVLADVRAAGVDAIVLNGDLATGPMPAETLDRLAELGETALWVRGNADRELVAAYDGHLDPDLPEVARRPTEYCAGQFAARHRELLAERPLSISLDVDGLGVVRFCHATARDDTEIVLVDSPIDRFQAAFAETEEATVLLGHTHMPFDRLADRRRFVNSGSVGMPFGGTGAYWALLGPDVTLRRTDYDLDAAGRAFRAAAPGYPDLDGFITHNLLSTPSDADVLKAWRK
ncbi:metallophosphoesterase family protein [Streptosporangiaceae bacterium NEAU-GS5]|nr:metallophosphoesterase family protein [Streptosporangiaceae bacterium NEAU-GS5]